MKAIMVMFDSLNRRMLSTYGCQDIRTPNFDRLAERAVTFDNFYIGSMPCMPARRELHMGRYNFMHRSWGPLEPFDDSMPEMLKQSGIYTHLVSDHQHYWEDGGCTYHTRYNSWEISRGQEGDLWKGMVKDPELSGYLQTGSKKEKELMKKLGAQDLNRQDAINREYLRQEEDMPQAVTFRNGLHFIERNKEEDNWFLQIETFDPHEPFFAAERFRELYPDPDYCGPEFDWPPYARMEQTEEEKEHCIKRYKALVSMCDFYLGTVLDAMDRYRLWDDTMLIVNTDHGFLLGEHGWWAKSSMPYYNEIAHIPFFLWDPRSGIRGERRQSLVQTIDIAPTLLEFFERKPAEDMMGKPLKGVVERDEPIRDYALFGSHGSHINITNGEFIYMRSPAIGEVPNEYTLMPTHMRSRFSTAELQNLELAEPFAFTKGCRTLKIKGSRNPFADPSRFGSKLFDVKTDPGQLEELDDPETEAKFIEEIRRQMLANDAPEELYGIFGINREKVFTRTGLEAERRASSSMLFPGLEEFKMDRTAYLQLSALLNLLPEENREQVLEGIRKRLKEEGTTEISGGFVVEFAGGLSWPEDGKELILTVLEGIKKAK